VPRAPTGLARALRVLLIVEAAAVALSALAALALRRSAHRYVDGRETLHRFDVARGLFVASVALYGALAIAIFVVTLVWQYRLAENHRRLDRPGTSLGTPGWAIGAWFIPIANLVLPFLSIRELWRGADPAVPPGDRRWKQARLDSVLWWWWLLFVGSNLVGLPRGPRPRTTPARWPKPSTASTGP
jgi:hypothetical protein